MFSFEGPKLLVTFCSGCTEGKDTGFMSDTTEDTSAFHKINYTLQGLADCIACSGNGLEVGAPVMDFFTFSFGQSLNRFLFSQICLFVYMLPLLNLIISFSYLKKQFQIL